MIANPPFSAKAWWAPLELAAEAEHEGEKKTKAPNYKQVSDPYGRFEYGIPPRGYADLAFAQHMLASLKADGRMGVILPHGVLSRSGEEGKIRGGFGLVPQEAVRHTTSAVRQNGRRPYREDFDV